jgi:quercetin dioxygenase-like cupin family protein
LEPGKFKKNRETAMSVCDWNNMKAEDVSWKYQRKAVEAGPLAVAMLEVLKGAATFPHAHANEEVILVLKGAWKFFLHGEEVILRDNQMLWIPAGAEHSSLALEDTLAVDICSSPRPDWKAGGDQALHYDPDQYLWAV